MNADGAAVVRSTMLELTVCVPHTYSNDEVELFANQGGKSGTKQGWKIRPSAPERCACDMKPGFVHLVLDC